MLATVMHRKKFGSQTIDPTAQLRFDWVALLPHPDSLLWMDGTKGEKKEKYFTTRERDASLDSKNETYGNGSTKLSSGNFRALPGRF